ncbi:MAG: hypothetical protein WCE73_14640, partial [Candidatus Angelobacter sp.]
MHFKTIHKQQATMRGAGLMNAHERINLWYLLVAITLLLIFAEAARPQEAGKTQPQTSSTALVPVTVTVSVETKHAKDFPVIYPE